MAGDWIKMTVALSTSPKVVRIVSATNADECPHRVRVVGALHAVWCLFDQHSTDGKLRGYSLQMIDEVIGWPGFATAMADADWLVITTQGIEMPEFDTHNGAPAKRRAQEADRKRRVRETSAPDADKKRTREEKRRVTTPIPPSGAFLKFWTSWPRHHRKQSRGKCWELWHRKDYDQNSTEILAHIEGLKAARTGRRKAGPTSPRRSRTSINADGRVRKLAHLIQARRSTVEKG
jgi:hypothetical protein